MTTPRTVRTRRAGALATLAGAASLAFAAVAAPATAQEGQPEPGPPGNNGTVKVNGEDIDGPPRHEPHVGCEFLVEWFNFDDGATSDVTFEMHAPTTTPVEPGSTPSTSEVHSGVDLGERVDMPDRQHAETFDLTGLVSAFEAHPNQGHHVRLTVNTEWSQGADNKHKMFWIQCEIPEPEEPNGDNGNGENGNGLIPDNGENGAEVDDVVVEREVVVEEEVLGEVVERPVAAAPAPTEVRGAQEARAQLPRTGNEATLALMALGLMMAGAGAMLYTPTAAGRRTS